MFALLVSQTDATFYSVRWRQLWNLGGKKPQNKTGFCSSHTCVVLTAGRMFAAFKSTDAHKRWSNQTTSSASLLGEKCTVSTKANSLHSCELKYTPDQFCTHEWVVSSTWTWCILTNIQLRAQRSIVLSLNLYLVSGGEIPTKGSALFVHHLLTNFFLVCCTVANISCIHPVKSP